MTPAIKPIPLKLKKDAILEAIFEIRFEATTIPEVLFGRLVDNGPWKQFRQVRLPASQIPETFRQSDPALRYTPVFELQDETNHRTIKIGPHALSVHQLAPYAGWAVFKPELLHGVDNLFRTAGDLTIERLGFRYVNALTADSHAIRSVADLDVSVDIAGDRIDGNLNINFVVRRNDALRCTVRIATPDFTSGPLPSSTSLIADIDVFTEMRLTKQEDVRAWLDDAHTFEKEQFFRLLKVASIESLRAE